MNNYNFCPVVYDATVNGVFTFDSVLKYHKSISDNMPQDGLIWLCENVDPEKLKNRQQQLIEDIRKLQAGMVGQEYIVWTSLDKQAQFLRSRLQLVSLCIENYYNN